MYNNECTPELSLAISFQIFRLVSLTVFLRGMSLGIKKKVMKKEYVAHVMYDRHLKQNKFNNIASNPYDTLVYINTVIQVIKVIKVHVYNVRDWIFHSATKFPKCHVILINIFSTSVNVGLITK